MRNLNGTWHRREFAENARQSEVVLNEEVLDIHHGSTDLMKSTSEVLLWRQRNRNWSPRRPEHGKELRSEDHPSFSGCEGMTEDFAIFYAE